MNFILLTLSWLLRTYGGVQESRDPLNKPLIWHNNIAVLFLTIIWIVLLLIGLYLTYQGYGLLIFILSLLAYFAVAPILFAPLIKQILNKIGF